MSSIITTTEHLNHPRIENRFSSHPEWMAKKTLLKTFHSMYHEGKEGRFNNESRQIIPHYGIIEALNLMQVIPFTIRENNKKERESQSDNK